MQSHFAEDGGDNYPRLNLRGARAAMQELKDAREAFDVLLVAKWDRNDEPGQTSHCPEGCPVEELPSFRWQWWSAASQTTSRIFPRVGVSEPAI